MHQQRPDWWGDVALQPGKTAHCHVAGFTLSLRALGSEWQVASRRDDSASDEGHASLTLGTDDPLADCPFERLVFSVPPERAYLRPALADRPVVSRPAQPLLLAPGQQTTIYVHAPLWLQLRSEADGKPLLDLPLAQLSDTWFGASTREGELCYASRTKARLQRDGIPARPHRAVTPVRLRNDAADPLRLDKLNLPEPYLALYSADDGLWTDTVELVRNAAGDIAPVHVISGVPPEASDGELICAPRRITERGGLLSSFTALFG